MRTLLAALGALLALASMPVGASAQDPTEGRLAAQAARTSQCSADDWGAPCALVKLVVAG